MIRVLVVEDEVLIALEICDLVREAGMAAVGPARTSKEALGILCREGCDVAVLDINLGHETSEAVARELTRQGVPFLTLSGYNEYVDEHMEAAYGGAIRMGKPIAAQRLLRELGRLADRSGSLEEGC